MTFGKIRTLPGAEGDVLAWFAGTQSAERASIARSAMPTKRAKTEFERAKPKAPPRARRHCGGLFEAKRSDQVYCSVQGGQRAYNRLRPPRRASGAALDSAATTR